MSIFVGVAITFLSIIGFAIVTSLLLFGIRRIWENNTIYYKTRSTSYTEPQKKVNIILFKQDTNDSSDSINKDYSSEQKRQMQYILNKQNSNTVTRSKLEKKSNTTTNTSNNPNTINDIILASTLTSTESSNSSCDSSSSHHTSSSCHSGSSHHTSSSYDSGSSHHSSSSYDSSSSYSDSGSW